jgi:hypothetical protein
VEIREGQSAYIADRERKSPPGYQNTSKLRKERQMSYNIDTWRTKKIEALTIPMDAFLVDGFDIRMTGASSVRIGGGSDLFKIEGQLVSGNVVVEKIYNIGEGSGHFANTLLDILRKSTGYLEAVLVWEGGDSITRLIAKDGEVTEANIEL